MPAPSPWTNPSRFLSKGRDAFWGGVVALRQGAHVGESVEAEVRHGRLGAADEHDVRVAVLDEPQGARHGVVRGGARGGDPEVGAAEAELDGDVARGRVEHHLGDEEGVGLGRAFLQVADVLLLQLVEPADAAGDDGAAAVLVLLGEVDPAVLPRLHGGGDGDVDERVGAADLLGVEPVGGIEILHLPAEPDLHPVGGELREEGDAALSGEAAFPERGNVVAERSDNTESGDDNPVLRHFCSSRCT
jgi:hypothetical protein